MKMKPLSIITHIRSNVKRLIPTIITLGLEFAALTFMISIGIGEIYAVKHNGGTLADKTVIVQLKENLSKDDIVKLKKEISNIEGVNEVLEGNTAWSSAILPIMYSSLANFKVHGNEMESLLNEFQCNLVQGELPKATDEILLTKEAMNTLNVKVGDWVGEGYNSVLSLGGSFKVSGVIEGKYPLFLSKANENEDIKELLVIAKSGEAEEASKSIRSLDWGVEVAADYKEYRDFIKDIFLMLKRLGFLVIGAFLIGMLITVINLSKSIISNFNDEYGILRAIGYNTKFIRGRIGKQLFVLLMGASFIGIIGGILVNIIFDKIYCVPKGIAYEEFNIYLIVIPIIVALILFVLTKFIISKKVKKIDFVGEMDL